MTATQTELSTLQTVVQQLIELASPVKIILFGSMARMEAHTHSDLDLLVIEENVNSPYEEALRLSRATANIGWPIDLVVISRREFERFSSVPGTIYYRSLNEGKVLYERQSI